MPLRFVLWAVCMRLTMCDDVFGFVAVTFCDSNVPGWEQMAVFGGMGEPPEANINILILCDFLACSRLLT